MKHLRPCETYEIARVARPFGRARERDQALGGGGDPAALHVRHPGMLSLDIGPRDEPREIALADRILDEQHQTVRFVGVLRVAHQEVGPWLKTHGADTPTRNAAAVAASLYQTWAAKNQSTVKQLELFDDLGEAA